MVRVIYVSLALLVGAAHGLSITRQAPSRTRHYNDLAESSRRDVSRQFSPRAEQTDSLCKRAASQTHHIMVLYLIIALSKVGSESN